MNTTMIELQSPSRQGEIQSDLKSLRCPSRTHVRQAGATVSWGGVERIRRKEGSSTYGARQIGDVVYRDIRCTEPRENPDLGSNLGGDPNCGEEKHRNDPHTTSP